jgi:hypothetical protein
MQTMMPPAVAIASSVPGRIRFKLPPVEVSGQDNFLRTALHSLPGVTDTRWTPLTSSLVVYYDHHRTSSEEIFARCQHAVVPLTVPNGSASAIPLQTSPVISVSPAGFANGGGRAPQMPGGVSASGAAAAASLSPWKRLAGTFLIVVGSILLIIPFVPGLPLLLMGLTLLQLA